MTIPATRFAAWLGLCLLALGITSAHATTPAFEIALDDGYCGVALGRDVVPPADTVPPLVQRFENTGDGRKIFDYGCALTDGFLWGLPDSPQAFTGSSIVRGFGELGFGQIRLSGSASAVVDPARYVPPGTIGVPNPYTAVSQHFASVSWVDVLTPPPTHAATAPGDPTTVTVQLHLDCVETGDSNPVTSLFAAFYTPQVFDQGHAGRLMWFDRFLFKTEQVLGHVPCKVDAPKQIAGKVGQPIVVWVGMTIVANGRLASDTSPVHFASSSTRDALTMFATDADGVPLIGASSHTYTPGVVLPTITTTTTSTTTSTLPPGPETCGDGGLDVGEQCDCASTSDPVAQGAGCAGAAVVPAQPACVLCRRCVLLDHLCAPPTTTTSTTIATSTTLPGDTTTTTLPGGDPCAGAEGIAHALCRLDGALRAPLCGTETIPTRVDGALRRKLTRARDLLETAGGRSGKALTRVLRRSRRALNAAGVRAGSASQANKPRKHMSAACAQTMTSLVGDTKADIQVP